MKANTRITSDLDSLLMAMCLQLYEDKKILSRAKERWRKDVMGLVALGVLFTVCLVLAAS